MADLVAVLSEGPRAQSCAPAINEHLLQTKRLFCRITLSGGGKMQSIDEDKCIHYALNLQQKSLFGGYVRLRSPERRQRPSGCMQPRRNALGHGPGTATMRNTVESTDIMCQLQLTRVLSLSRARVRSLAAPDRLLWLG